MRNELVWVLAQNVRDQAQRAVQACGGGVGVLTKAVVTQQGLDAAVIQPGLYPVEVQQQLVQPRLFMPQGQVGGHVADEVGIGVRPVVGLPHARQQSTGNPVVQGLGQGISGIWAVLKVVHQRLVEQTVNRLLTVT